MRYRQEKTAFVVHAMTVLHHREVTYGERPTARTWVSRFRRGVLSTRQVRIFADDGPIASANQEWVHVDAQIRPTRAGEALLAAFPVHDEGQAVGLPPVESDEGPVRTFSFECWYTSMDPLDHANHPAYVDWCDESTARIMVAGGLVPVSLVPVAEEVKFRAAVSAGERVTVETRRLGRTNEGTVVLGHRILKQGGILCAEATTIRALVSGDAGSLSRAFG